MIQTTLVKQKTYRLPYVRTYENGKEISHEEERKRQIDQFIKENPPRHVIALFKENKLFNGYTEDFDVTLNRILSELDVEVIDIQYKVTTDTEGNCYREALILWQ